MCLRQSFFLTMLPLFVCPHLPYKPEFLGLSALSCTSLHPTARLVIPNPQLMIQPPAAEQIYLWQQRESPLPPPAAAAPSQAW